MTWNDREDGSVQYVLNEVSGRLDPCWSSQEMIFTFRSIEIVNLIYLFSVNLISQKNCFSFSKFSLLLYLLINPSVIAWSQSYEKKKLPKIYAGGRILSFLTGLASIWMAAEALLWIKIL